MQLKDVMTEKVETVRPDATLQEAAQKMKKLDVGPLPVCDGDRIVGMLTDRDITIRAIAEGRNPTETKVREVMTPDVLYCMEDQDVEEAAHLMQAKKVRRLAILNREKRLVGMVSLGDLATRGEESVATETLTEVSKPS
jgi:CBS domain-containing protein